jgi:hypothetical protein
MTHLPNPKYPMNFWRKLLGVKESPKIEIAEWKPTQPCTTSDPQPPSIQPIPATQLQGTSPQALRLAAQDQSASFHEAVKGGDLEKVKTLLEGNPNLVFSADNPNGYTPLHCAALKGQKDVAALLLASKAVINAKDNCGRTPLHDAAIGGNTNEVELLLANKAEVNAREGLGKTPLHYAAAIGHKDVAALLLASEAEVNAVDGFGETALHYSALVGRHDLAALLREHGGHEQTSWKPGPGRIRRHVDGSDDSKKLMKKNHTFAELLMLLALSALNLQPSTAHAQGTACTYQGQLNDRGGPANGLYDLRFQVWDALTNGNLVAGPLTSLAASITNGLFAVTLDFGPGVFTGPGRWLELDVRTNGNGAFTTLLPLQQILPMPYAVMANTASNLLGVLPAEQLSGTLPSSALAGYSGPVAFTNPADSFYGSFSGFFQGNGGGLTNRNVTNLPFTLEPRPDPALRIFSSPPMGYNTFYDMYVLPNHASITNLGG